MQNLEMEVALLCKQIVRIFNFNEICLVIDTHGKTVFTRERLENSTKNSVIL